LFGNSLESAKVIYQRRFQALLDYLYGSQRCEQISELIRLHLRSRLVLNTLFLTVNLFDRAILTGQVPRESYSDGNPHLLLTCLLIAGKFEEVEVSENRGLNNGAYLSTHAIPSLEEYSLAISYLLAQPKRRKSIDESFIYF
jgi:hypothetical protein